MTSGSTGRGKGGSVVQEPSPAEAGTQRHYIEPRSPWQNGFDESFHSRLRDECLNGELFATVAEACVVAAGWQREYNHERPHTSLGYRTALEFRLARKAEHAPGERWSL